MNPRYSPTLWGRLFLSLAAAFALAAAPSAQTAFINELHYDDVDADNDEAVELAVPTGTDVSTLVVTLYNGNGGATYGTAVTGDQFTAGTTTGGYTFYSYIFPANGLQNGAPDGIALSTSGGTLIEFISYEGSFAGVGGPADGVTSMDIGVAEDNSTLEGQSLQLTGPGSSKADFSWTGPVPASLGMANAGQTFTPMGGGGSSAGLVVTTSADELTPNGFCSLREAVRAANGETAGGDCGSGAADGDRITFAATVLTPILLTLGEITITDDVTIDGSSLMGRVTIDASGRSRIFDLNTASGAGADTDVDFVSLILQNGNSGQGGSSAPDAGGAVDLKAGSNATFTDVDVTGSVAGINGGGIHGAGNTDIVITTSMAGASRIAGNEARGNESNRGGGGVWGAGSVTITGNVTIQNNRATGTSGSGGGVFNLDGTLVIGEGVTIRNNLANRAGGGVESTGGTVTLTGVLLLRNNAGTAPGNGGGLHGGGASVITVTGGEARENQAVEGGGLWISSGGSLTVSEMRVVGNLATGTDADQGGGGLYSDGGVLTVQNSTVWANQAVQGSGSGGGILNKGGALTVRGTALRNNASSRAGGAIESAGGTVDLTDARMIGNDAGTSPGNGGGFHGGGAVVVTVSGGRASDNTAVEGGALWISGDGSLTVSSMWIGNNTASGNDADQGGGGLYIDAGTATLDDVVFEGNAATGTSGSGGGILNNGGMLTMTGGELDEGRANRAGGGLEAAGGTSVLSGVLVEMNDAGTNPGNGGGIHAGGQADLTLTDLRIRMNTAVEGGGFWINAGGMLMATGLEVHENVATGADAEQGGGGFYNDGGQATIVGSVFQANEASGTSGSGGAILNNLGMLTVTDTRFVGNTSNRAGGAIEDRAGSTATGSMVVLRGVTMERNDAGANPGNGGGLHISGAGRVLADSSIVRQNTAANEGGGLWNSGVGSLEVTYTTVAANTATDGAGVYQQMGDDGITLISNSTLSGNQASGAGGGLALDGGTVTVTNSTLSGNSAATGAGASTMGGRLLLSNATVARNTASTAGGGLANAADGDPSDLSPDNTLVGDNAAPTGADLFGPVMSRGYNLFETTAGATITMDEGAMGDITGEDPQLGSLADNGGPTRTHAIALSSPAVNTGMTALTIDQRGATRRGTADIGAFESDAAPTAGEDFATEFADGETMRMSPVAPNPFRGTAELSLAVRESQTVRVALYDVMGRQVSVLHDGPMAASTAYDLTVDARSLASGVYVIVVRGESVQGTQQITVAR